MSSDGLVVWGGRSLLPWRGQKIPAELSDHRAAGDYLSVYMRASTPLTNEHPEPIVEPTAQDNLYCVAAKEFGPALGRLAKAYEVDLAHQQDLLQDIHFALWRSFAGFDQRCSLRTWVYRVAHNTAATHVLRGKRRRSTQLVTLDELENVHHEADSERLVDEAAVIEKLHGLIQKLRPSDRDVILLYLEEIEGAEIAQIVGLSPDNVAQKIHRIKKLMRKHFSSGASHVDVKR